MSQFTLHDLERIIKERGQSGAADSWTAKLFAKGTEKAAQKLGEEATEAVIAAVTHNKAELTKESADIVYHLLVVLALEGIALDDVLAELSQRTGQSGVAEKQARKTD